MVKSKGVVSDSKLGHGIVSLEDAKARRLKLQALMQSYQQLQKEVDAMRRNLAAANRRKIMVAAEVRFLRRKHHSLVKGSTTSGSLSILSEQMRGSTGRFGTEEVRGSELSSNCGTNKVGVAVKSKHGKEVAKDSNTFIVDSRDRIEANGFHKTERAPLFDLNEISVGDEDMQEDTEPVMNKRVPITCRMT